MTTRFYPFPTSTPVEQPSITPAYAAEWDNVVDGARRWMRSSAQRALRRDETSQDSQATAEVSAILHDILFRQFISHPLEAQTISGTIKGQMHANESNAAMDARAQVVAKVVSRDGSVVRGTLYAGDTAALSQEYALTTPTNRKFPRGGAVAVTPVVCQKGDRIVVETGARIHNVVTTSYTVEHRTYGGISHIDLPEDETTTTTPRAAWFELSADVTFEAPAVTVRSSTTGFVDAGSAARSLVVNKPAGAAVGDLLLAFVGSSDNDLPSAEIAAVAGWTVLRDDQCTPASESEEMTAQILYRWVDGTEPASWTWAIGDPGTGNTDGAVGAIYALVGVNPTDPFGPSGFTIASSAAAPSVTPEQSNGGLLFCRYQDYESGSGIGYFPGELIGVEIENSTNQTMCVGYEWWGLATATGTRAITHPASTRIAQSVIVNSIPPNVPPNAPTLTDKTNFSATATERFYWAFSDNDVGNTQTAYQLRVIRVSDSAVVYDTGKQVSVNQYHDIPGGTLVNNVAYQWEVRTYDNSDVVGPYSTRDSFTTSAAPTATITLPAVNGDTVTSSSLTTNWNFSDPEGAAQGSYRAVLKKAGAVVEDTGKTASSAARSKTFSATLINNANDYSVEITVWDAADVSSAVAVRTFITSFTPPPTPTLQVQAL